jgi:hypothetical protein
MGDQRWNRWERRCKEAFKWGTSDGIAGNGGAKRLFSFLSPFPAIPSLVPPSLF